MSAGRATCSTEGEVEELLRAAQDELLVKLSVNSHTISRRPTLPSSPPFSSAPSSSSSLHPDLCRRLDALRSHPPLLAPTASSRRGGGGGAPAAPMPAGGGETTGGIIGGEDELNGIFLGDDLAARFAALKVSSSSYLPADGIARPPDGIPKGVEEDGSDGSDDVDDGVSEEEVEKVMQWAKDAARLDTDSNGWGIGKDEEGGEAEEEEGGDVTAAATPDEKKKKTKKRAEAKNPPLRKWFFF